MIRLLIVAVMIVRIVGSNLQAEDENPRDGVPLQAKLDELLERFGKLPDTAFREWNLASGKSFIAALTGSQYDKSKRTTVLKFEIKQDGKVLELPIGELDARGQKDAADELQAKRIRDESAKKKLALSEKERGKLADLAKQQADWEKVYPAALSEHTKDTVLRAKRWIDGLSTGVERRRYYAALAGLLLLVQEYAFGTGIDKPVDIQRVVRVLQSIRRPEMESLLKSTEVGSCKVMVKGRRLATFEEIWNDSIRIEVGLQPKVQIALAEPIGADLKPKPDSRGRVLKNDPLELPRQGGRKDDPAKRFVPAPIPLGWRELPPFATAGAAHNKCALSPDGTTLASGDSGQYIRFYDVDSGALLRQIRRADSEVHRPAFFADGRLVFAVGRHRVAELWEQSGDSPSSVFRNDPNSETHAVAVSADEKWIATSGNSSIVTVWNTATGEPIRRIEHGLPRGTLIAFCAKDACIACADESSNAIAVCDRETGRRLQNLAGHTAGIVSLASGRKNGLLASTSRDGTVRVWDAAGSKQLLRMTVASGTPNSLSMRSDERLVAVGVKNGTVEVWNLDDGNRLIGLRTNLPTIETVDFSHDGSRLVACSWAPNTRFHVWHAVFAGLED